MTAFWIIVCGAGVLLFISGCSSSIYSYRVINDDCNCEEYVVYDGEVEYHFRAEYQMNEGVATMIKIEFINKSNELLSLDLAEAKVSSRNISYQYNDKFLPLPSLTIGPHSSDFVKLLGKETESEDDWHKIAGEQLTVTIKGLSLGSKTLKEQHVTFVPVNPKLRK